MTLPPSLQLEITELARCTCCCGKEVVFGETADGTPAGFHEDPGCREFVQLELLDYMTWLRRKTVGYAPGEDS